MTARTLIGRQAQTNIFIQSTSRLAPLNCTKQINTHATSALSFQKAQEYVNTYTGTQINKRLTTHIEKQTNPFPIEIETFDSESRTYKKSQKMIPQFSTSLNHDYGSHKLNIYENTPTPQGVNRITETVYFDGTLEDLKKNITARLSGLDEQIENYVQLDRQLDSVIDRYETASKAISEINDIKGIYSLREYIKDLR